MVKVKICGMQRPEDVRAAVQTGADYLGFVLAPSKRRITLATGRELVKQVPKQVRKVGVFVNPSHAEIVQAIQALDLDVIQLHGQETPEFVAKIEKPVIKAFPVKNGNLPATISKYKAIMPLLDAPPTEFEGGSGNTFDWEQTNIQQLISTKLIIAGGLTPENVRSAINYFHPYCVDVSSGVETAGKKDSTKIEKFIEAAKGVKAK